MADTKNAGDDRVDPADAAQQLGPPAGAAGTIDQAFGPTTWDAWQQHVIAHVPAPDADGDGYAEMPNVVVPLFMYGEGPHAYIATSVEGTQVVVRDGQDKTGRAWNWPLSTFLRFVAAAHGKKVEGDPVEVGDNPYEAAVKQNARTAKLIEADRVSQRTGEARPAGSTRAEKNKQ